MEVGFFLIVTDSGAIRTVKSKPTVKHNEISIAMQLDLPDSLFDKPTLQARIIVDDKQVNTKELEVKMLSNIQEAIEERMNSEVTLRIVKKSEVLNNFL